MEKVRAADLRRAARGKLRGKWGTAAAAMFVYSLLMAVCALTSYLYIGLVGALLLGGPLMLGLVQMALNVWHGRRLRVEQLFDGFKNFGAAFVLNLLVSIFTFLWSLLLVVPGIVKHYSYAMGYFVLCDEPDLGGNRARKRSMELMRGHKWQLFCLRLSYIGWYLLCILTLGILYFWVFPYLKAAEAELYRTLVPVREEQGGMNGTAQGGDLFGPAGTDGAAPPAPAEGPGPPPSESGNADPPSAGGGNFGPPPADGGNFGPPPADGENMGE